MNLKDKRLLSSFLLIGVTAAIAIAGTAAYFTATRTASTNRFETGTIDLSAESGGVANEPFVLENLGEDGNLSGSKTWTIENTGSLPGRLLFRIQNVNNEENGCNDPEVAAEATCNDNAVGELGGLVELIVKRDGTQVATSTLANADANEIGTLWNGLTPIVLQPGETTDIELSWALGRDEYGNEIQSDSVEFDANFRLIQLLSTGPTPTN